MIEEWQNSYEKFFAEATRLYLLSYDEDRASEQFWGKSVNWAGVVAKVMMDAKYGDIVNVRVPRAERRLPSGVMAIGDWLALPIAKRGADVPVRSLRVGDHVEFEASFVPRGHVFPCIQFMVDPDQNAVFFAVSLRSARLIRRAAK